MSGMGGLGSGKGNFPSTLVMFPCLRCGKWGVPVSLLSGLVRRDEIISMCCEVSHLLEIAECSGGYEVCYQRYTLRDPIEMYDPGPDPEVRLHGVPDTSFPDAADGNFRGPVRILRRKRRYSREEVVAIWRQSKGRCHICGCRWGLAGRSRDGWHVDHVIPHVGGGNDTESMPNFRVACARCNLAKGRGYTDRDIRLAIRDLIAHYERNQRALDRLLRTRKH